MKTCGLRRARLAARVHVCLRRQPVALAAVARRARGDDVLPARVAALGARDDVVDRQARTGAAVLARPAVAREHRAARDLAAVRVARDVDVADEPDHDRARQRRVLGAQLEARALDELGLLLEQQHGGAANRADVDRLVGRVEDEHPPRLTSARPVLAGRRGPCWRWWGDPAHRNSGAQCNGAARRGRRIGLPAGWSGGRVGAEQPDVLAVRRTAPRRRRRTAPRRRRGRRRRRGTRSGRAGAWPAATRSG